MKVIAGEGRRGPAAAVVVIAVAVFGMTSMIVTGTASPVLMAACAGVTGLAVLSKPLLRWNSMLTLLVGVVLFIPIRRYSMGGVGFQLEPYRLLVALLILAWGSSLLIDQRVRKRPTGLKGPLSLILVTVLLSDVFNASSERTQLVQSEMVKSVTFFLSFILLVGIIVSLVRTEELRDRMLKLMVGGGAVLGALAMYESRTGYNFFDHLHSVMPILKPYYFGDNPLREGRVRAYASAEHPIALGALFAMILPFSFYLLHKFKERRWGIAGLFICAGAFATVSRTAMIMLTVVVIVYAILKFKDVKRFWPALIPLVALVHFAMPGAIGTITASFHPQGGLVKEQTSSAGSRAAAGRLADLPGAFKTFEEDPLLGYGYGTSLTTGPKANAPILDDQWLGTLLETGVAGIFGWLWLFARFIRRTGREAKRDGTDRSWLMAAFCAAVSAFAVGMITYDAFSFIQEVLVLFILLALGASALLDKQAAADARAEAAAAATATA